MTSRVGVVWPALSVCYAVSNYLRYAGQPYGDR